MKKIFIFKNLIILFCFIFATAAFGMELAITVDGIPAHGELFADISRTDVANQMLNAFKKHHLPSVYGMVVGNSVTAKNHGSEILTQWLISGNKLGNHTFSHPDLNVTDAKVYIADIEKTHQLLSSMVHDNSYKYFRYPYLSKGNTSEKKIAVKKYLNDRHYQVAPVTLDFTDYLWNEAYLRCLKKNDEKAVAWLKISYINDALNALKISHLLSNALFGRDIHYILLIHMGVFEALMLDDLLNAYEKEKVKFITLPYALKDDAYASHSDIVQKVTYPLSFKNYSAKHSIAYPLEVEKLNNERPIKILNHICR